MAQNEEDAALLDLLSRVWWLMALRGLTVISYGVLTFLSPGHAVTVSASLFGLYILLSGLLTLIMGLRTHRLAWRVSTFIVPGGISLVVAAFLFVLPGLGLLGIIGLGGVWSGVLGIIEVLLALRVKGTLLHRVTLFAAGVTSVLLGGAILLWPEQILLFDLRNVTVTSLVLGSALLLLSPGMRYLNHEG